MSHVNFKKYKCRPVQFKKYSCCTVDLKKSPCPYVSRSQVARYLGLKNPYHPVFLGVQGRDGFKVSIQMYSYCQSFICQLYHVETKIFAL